VQTPVDPAVAALVLNLCVSRASKDWASLRRARRAPRAGASQRPQGVVMEDGDRGETVGLYEAAARQRLESIVGSKLAAKSAARDHHDGPLKGSAMYLRSAAVEAVRLGGCAVFDSNATKALSCTCFRFCRADLVGPFWLSGRRPGRRSRRTTRWRRRCWTRRRRRHSKRCADTRED
jgi:hypothetical protein